MTDFFDLSSSSKIVRYEELREREKAQRAAKQPLAVGAKTLNESAVLTLLRADGPHNSIPQIADKVKLDPTTTSKVVSDLIERGAVRRTEDGLYGQKARISAA